jgi:WD40 repeat protein
LDAPEHWAGRLSSCPVCQAPLEIPEDGGQIAELGDAEVKEDEKPGVYNLNTEDARRSGPAAEFGAVGMLRLGREEEPAGCLALHADQRLGLAGCGEDVFVLDLDEGKRSFRFGKQKAWVSCLAIAPDGRRVLSGDEDGGLALWDLESKKVVRWLAGHARAVRSVAFSPNGRYAVSGGNDGVTRLWELESGKEYEFFEARWNGPVKWVAFSPDGRQVLGVGMKVRTWSVSTGEPVLRFENRAKMVSAAFSRDGSEIAACAPGNSLTGLKVQRWDARTGRGLSCFENPDPNPVTIKLVAVLAGSLRIVSMGEKPPTGPLGKACGDDDGVYAPVMASVLFGATGYLAYMAMRRLGSLGHTPFEPADPYCLQVWTMRTGYVQPYGAGKVAPTALAVSSDGTRALTADRDGMICFWNLPV